MAQMIRGNNTRLLEPGLRKIFFNTIREKPPQYSEVLRVNTSRKAIETDLRMGGFSMWDEKGTTASTEYENPTPSDIVQYKHVTFSKGFIIEKELVDDELYNQIKKMPQALARAARATIEFHGAKIFNDAYTPSALNWKGESLISPTHALLGGGTTSNYIGKLTLSEPSLEIAHKLANEQVDERGIKIQMNPDTLVVPRALEMTARKIVHTTEVPSVNTNDTFAKNDWNPYKGKYKIVVLDYLTDPNNWFLVDSQIHQLNWFWRERLNFKSTNDFDTDMSKYKGRMRFSYGWTDHRGVLGADPDDPA